MFSEEARNLFKNDVNSWKLCFEIICKNGRIIRLTDASKPITYEEKEFLCHSSIKLQKALFEESGYGEIVLNGNFEEKGIDLHSEILDAEISIYFYFSEIHKLEKYIIYYCSEFIKNSIFFDFKLLPITKKYESTIVEFYSTTCRAKFGDLKCGIDRTRYEGQGCDKSFGMCCNKYNNAVNFRGEPFIPYLGYFNSVNDE